MNNVFVDLYMHTLCTLTTDVIEYESVHGEWKDWRAIHCKNVWVISTCFYLPELLTSIDDCNSDNHKWVETTQTFLQCKGDIVVKQWTPTHDQHSRLRLSASTF